MDEKNLIKFKEKAALVSAILHEIDTMDQAFEITADLCLKKKPCEQLMKSDNALSPNKNGKNDKKEKSPGAVLKTIAAPGLEEALFSSFESLCMKNEILLLKEGLRGYPGGIDIGFSIVDYGIAETGTLVLSSDSEELRLATMLSEIHVAVLKKSDIRESATGMAEELNALTCRPSSYTAFITGASRTADIERVLALGVHGPLELHILILEA
jgi:L-lactate dehydrogenase complex protein LldG